MPYFTAGELVSTTKANVLASGGQLDYAQITADVTGLNATTEGAAQTIITGNAVTYDGMRVKIEVFAPGASNTGGTGAPTYKGVFLRDATVLGQFNMFPEGSLGAAAGSIAAVFYDTPSAASHTYAWKFFVSGGSGATITVRAGAGGTGNFLPAFLRVTRAE